MFLPYSARCTGIRQLDVLPCCLLHLDFLKSGWGPATTSIRGPARSIAPGNIVFCELIFSPRFEVLGSAQMLYTPRLTDLS